MADNTDDAQNQEIMTVPAYYANRIFVSFSNDGFRVSFGEQTMDAKVLRARTAVMLSKEGVKQLEELCGLILSKAEEMKKAAN